MEFEPPRLKTKFLPSQGEEFDPPGDEEEGENQDATELTPPTGKDDPLRDPTEEPN